VLRALLAGAGAPRSPGSERVTRPPGFELGALTLEQALQLPRFVAGIDAGVFTVERITAHFAEFDVNGNGVLCYKHVPGLEHAGAPYSYEIIDDPGGNPG